jgi:hypothetical protein
MVCEQNTLTCDQVKQRAALSALYAEWLMVRGQAEAGDLSDEECTALCDREGDLARMIWAMPAATTDQVLRKFELLDIYRNTTSWSDQRDLRLIASIKADLAELLD